MGRQTVTMTTKRKRSLRRRWTDHFVAGLLVLAPAYITLLIVGFLIKLINRLFGPLVRLLDPWLTTTWATLLVQAGAVLIFIVGVTLIGWGAKILVLRRLFSGLEQGVVRLPMVGKVYSAMRELAQAFSGEHKTAFSRVVLIEFLSKGQYAIGFVTHEGKGEVQTKTPEHVVNVFVPTTPNPTSGFLVLVDRTAMIPLDMSVEEGMKLVISGGVVGPPVPTLEKPKGR